MKKLIFFSKILAYLCISTVFSIIIFFYLLYLTNLPQKYIINLIEYYSKEKLNITLNIGNITGNIFSNLSLVDIECYSKTNQKKPIITIKKLYIHYNPFKALLQLNIPSSIEHIGISKMDYYITRNDNGDWNNILTKNKKQSKQSLQIPIVNKNIIIKDSTVIYTDYFGWDKKKLSAPFKTSITNINGSIVANKKRNQINLLGKLYKSNEPISISGHINFNNLDYLLEFNTKNLNTNKWAPYVIPNQVFNLSGDNVDIKGYIKNKFKTDQNKFPFLFNLDIKTDNTMIEFPFLTQPIQNLTGNVTITNSKILPQTILFYDQKTTKKQQSTIINELQKNNIINNNYSLNHIQTLPNTTSYNNDTLSTIINSKPMFIHLNNIEGSLANNKVTINGPINITKQQLYLNVKTHQFKSQQLHTLVPEIEPLNLHDPLNISLTIKDNLNNPLITGQATASTLSLLDFKFNDIKSSFIMTPNTFNLSIKEASLYNGRIQGQLNSEFNLNNKTLNATIIGSDITIQKLIPFNNMTITGNTNINLSIKGDNNQIKTNIHLKSSEATFLNQSINQLTTDIITSSEKNIIQSAKLYINNSTTPINFEQISTQNNHNIKITAKHILINDPDPLSKSNTGTAIITANITTPIYTTLFPTSLNNITSDINTSLTKGSLLNTSYQTCIFSGKTKEDTLLIDTFNLTNNHETINITGNISLQSPKKITIKANNISLNNLPFITNKLPNNLKPISGNISTTISVETPDETIPTHYLNNSIIKADIQLKNALINEQKITNAKASVIWKNEHLTINNLMIEENQTKIHTSGTINKKTLDLTFKQSALPLNKLTSLLNPVLTSKGLLLFSGKLNGPLTNPNIELNFNLNDAQFEQIPIDKLLGEIKLNNKQLTFKDTQLHSKKGNLLLNGNIDIKSLTTITPLIDIQLNVSSFEISTIENLLSQIISIYQSNDLNLSKEINSTIAKKTNLDQITYKNPYFNKENVLIFSNISNKTSIGYIEKMQENTLTPSEKPEKKSLFSQGLTSGELTLTLSKEAPVVESNISIKELQTPFLTANNVFLTFKPNKNNHAYKFSLNDAHINNKKINNFEIKGDIDNSYILTIDKSKTITTTLSAENYITGTIPLPFLAYKQSDRPLNINLNLKPNELSLLSLLTTEIKEIKHNKNQQINVTGTLKKPILNTTNTNNDTYTILLPNSNPFIHNIKLTNFNATITDNTLNFNNTPINLSKNNTDFEKDKTTLIISGNVMLEDLNLVKRDSFTIQSNLQTFNESYPLDIQNFFIGDVLIKSLSITGPFMIPLTQETKIKQKKEIHNNNYLFPKLKGSITINNSSILISPTTESDPIPIEYDLDITVNNNNEIITTLLGNSIVGVSTDLELEQNPTPIKLLGNSYHPRLENTIFIKDANLSLLNKEFELLSDSKQLLFNQLTNSELTENSISFDTVISNDNIEEINPNLKLKTITTIESSPTNNVFIIMSIDNALLNLEEIRFDIFQSSLNDPISSSDINYQKSYTINNSSITQSNPLEDNDTSEFIRLLMPELFNTENNNDAILTEIGKTQLNTFLRRSFIRPLENQLSKRAGFDDVQINYNFGEQLLNKEENNQAIGIQFIRKTFSDQLFLRVKTHVELFSEENTSSETIELSEIELIYYLLKNRNVSINFGQIKNEEQENNYETKVSLRYRYEY